MASPKSVFVSPGLGTCQMFSTDFEFDFDFHMIVTIAVDLSADMWQWIYFS